MEIHLMQHGTSLSKDIDPDRPLSPVGRDQIGKSGQAVKKMGLEFDIIVASPKLRAEQTAEIIAEHIGHPAKNLHASDKVKAMSDPGDLLGYLKEFGDLESVLVTGHLPHIPKFASHLCVGDASALKVDVDNGGLLCLESPDLEPASGVLLYYLTPMQLQIIADS
jgi:phosphohistidine phosphatase